MFIDINVLVNSRIPRAPDHDANIVATMLAHGERRLLTFNGTDFHRFGDRIALVAT